MSAPKCFSKKLHDDCFAINKGFCEILNDTNFKKPMCPFYKPKDVYLRDAEKYGATVELQPKNIKKDKKKGVK